MQPIEMDRVLKLAGMHLDESKGKDSLKLRFSEPVQPQHLEEAVVRQLWHMVVIQQCQQPSQPIRAAEAAYTDQLGNPAGLSEREVPRVYEFKQLARDD